MSSLAEQLDALLPQTQCQRCGFPRCYDYAEALASGESEVNRCPPGDAYTRNALADLLKVEPGILNPECGVESPRLRYDIVEAQCIGCTLCIQACPVDAIIGCAKKMHSILTDECTGCDLCIPVCPVDCIGTSTYLTETKKTTTNQSDDWPEYNDDAVARARHRTNARLNRLEKLTQKTRTQSTENESDHIRREIVAAVQRASKKK